VRGDLVPHIDTYKIRVRESTKGLSKDVGDRFKELVKRTKRDAKGACDGWRAMDREVAGNPSILFNLGLCAEQVGEYESAVRLYQDAVRAGAGEGVQGADRAAQLIAGREDARERARLRRGAGG
jgi:tetratricopeptide (TPR) repeat protein